MRALILSCNTGEGHNSCAKAIREAYLQHGDECVIEDALRFISDGASKIISKGHVAIYRYFPSLFGKAYGFSEDHPSFFETDSVVGKVMSGGTQRLYRFIEEGKYDIIVSTHVFSAMMMTAVRHEYCLLTPTSFVATDYTCSPGVGEINMDAYFIPTEALRSDFMSKGVMGERIIVSGIPIRGIFSQSTPKETAKYRYNIPTDSKHILITTGSMGCGPVEELTQQLSAVIQKDTHVTVVCGTNKKLNKRLKKSLGGNRLFHILGYVKDMSLLMDSADLYLTKPGGISMTEAWKKRLPTVLLNAVSGCEKYNFDYFISLGTAVSAENVRRLARLTAELISDEDRLLLMTEAYDRHSTGGGAELIYGEMNKLLAYNSSGGGVAQ